jgi:hypothetical protein
MDLRKGVKDKISELGVIEASKFFGVSSGTISNWANGKTPPSLDAAQMVLEVPEPPQVLPEPVWEGRKVHILLPVYKTFSAATHYSLFANYAKYGPSKIALTMQNRTLIVEARNILSHKALESDSEWFIFVDDDMVLPCGSAGIINGRYGGKIPEPGASMNAITRLMSHPAHMKIVGGLYFGRHPKGMAQCALGLKNPEESDKLRRHKYTSPISMAWVGTGLVKIHRSVFEELKKHIDSGKWPECKPVNDESWYGFWNQQGPRIGEDVSFGRRCNEIGIESYLDPVLECLHVGDVPWGSHNTSNP